MFLIAAIGAMAYYAMWTGLGVMYKTTDKTPRVIFWGRYLEQLLTQPVRICALSCLDCRDGSVRGPCVDHQQHLSCNATRSFEKRWQIAGNASYKHLPPELFGVSTAFVYMRIMRGQTIHISCHYVHSNK
jgi:hypothetical protein